MRVRKGATYVYRPALLDVVDARTELKPGDEARVVHPPRLSAPAHDGPRPRGDT
jgi:hypothetical protein